ncbi:hypothetical protein O4160_13455 [Rhodococcus sp. IEGM 1401]|uniref:hypothetical protein n=1 Tax=unclassified Rhodococcus (in: high G+C Gram-positive bacteria) TaxID=192944 RepID=UPI001FB38CA4|nr:MULTISPECIES: hypothetical protein [unclassified Rhodococcus (in: high G+C Gram-positive bacteria)]MCJ0894350.1 hypothetical protein [Rhodococcus sp. ARC_M5]MCJ0980555.1 hypothetical protein [Rhodococcus sp. ARC_M12]MCZ4561841.1 hypothetical protein [Rhodococcus sp. IEGM 1401]MDI9921982.1 hypothetical protein [Rhodococcus sp. IEGM 1372]MDV8034435.1 hypothetical protein [Rhodococcus sp. IEGM 1414]
MRISALGPPRLRTVIAVAAVLYLLAHTIAQCGIAWEQDHHSDGVHIVSSSSQAAAELSPNHAHIDVGSPHMAHDTNTVIAMPRSDNPPRPSTIAAVAAMAFAVVLVAMSAPRNPRAPPDLPIPIRHGRTVLNELCINRC